jgi:hypothetical protein
MDGVCAAMASVARMVEVFGARWPGKTVRLVVGHLSRRCSLKFLVLDPNVHPE